MSLGGYADIFFRNVRASGVIPQISVIMGPCAGGAVYIPGHHRLRLHGARDQPHVHHRPGGHQDRDRRGRHHRGAGRGARATRPLRASRTSPPTRTECLEMVRELLSFLPSNNLDPPPFVPTDDPGDRSDRRSSLDRARRPHQAVRHARGDHRAGRRRRRLPRGGAALRARTSWWGSPGWPATPWGRGQPAEGPRRRARHRRLDQGGPLRPLLRRLQHPAGDVRGRARLPAGHEQEYGGIILHGAKLLYAYGEATVPKLTVITRKAYGGAYDVMNSKHVGADFNAAWPTAEIAVMGPRARSTSSSAASWPRRPTARRRARPS